MKDEILKLDSITKSFDNKKILIPGGRGFVAVVSSEEKFPEQSVKIRYRIKK